MGQASPSTKYQAPSTRAKHALLSEVGPRDGFQFEAKPIPTDLKLDIIGGLVDAGLKRIQVTSFVHPKWVPQMADAEDLLARLPQHDDVTYTGLALNQRGLQRAHDAGLQDVDLSIATNDQHGRDNANMSVEDGVQQGLAMVEWANSHGMRAQMNFQTVFGYASPGDTPLETVVAMAQKFVSAGVDSLALSDSTGMANPLMIQERVRAVQEVLGDTPLVMHLHDTRGVGLANVVAALDCGVTWFDTSLGGMGGCPFIPGATGNIATEDTAYLLEQMGVATGITIERVAALSRQMEDFLGKPLSGKMHRLLTPATKEG